MITRKPIGDRNEVPAKAAHVRAERPFPVCVREADTKP